jgi:DNA-binding XRE family transcriptional regulator
MTLDEHADEADPTRLRAARLLAKISTAEMGRLCGVESTTITAYERGERWCRIPRSRVAVYERETAGSMEYFYGEGPDLPQPRGRK